MTQPNLSGISGTAASPNGAALPTAGAGGATSVTLPQAGKLGVAGSTVSGAAGLAGRGGADHGVAGAAGATGAAGVTSAGTAGAAIAGAGGPIGAAGASGAAAAAGAAAPAAGAAGVATAGSSAPSATTCGASARNATPFGCGFAWGTNDPGGSLSAFAGLQFMSKWVGYELDANGNLPSCDGCTWLMQQVQPTELIPVYYAYFIGFFGKAHGLPDGNENPNGPNLTTDAAKLIRSERPALIAMYSSYAKQSAAVWKDKPLVWLLEGDFVQYSGDSQKEPLSYQELGDLARDITCAIKAEMPNAVVAINHSTWNGDEITNNFWAAMSNVDYDLVWTTAVANNQGFLEMGADASKYNAKTATFAYLHELTGRNLFVDTSFGISQMSDSWSSADAATLNARISEGVIAANVTMPPTDYVSKVSSISSQLQKVCQ